MKKIIGLFIAVALIFVFAGCSVSSTMGKLTVTNTSDKTLTNVKIGDTVITSSLSAGSSYEYWISSEVKGKLTYAGVETDASWSQIKEYTTAYYSLTSTQQTDWRKENTNPNNEMIYTLKPNVWYTLTTKVVSSTATYPDSRSGNVYKNGIGMTDYALNTIGSLDRGVYYIDTITAVKQANGGDNVKYEDYRSK